MLIIGGNWEVLKRRRVLSPGGSSIEGFQNSNTCEGKVSSNHQSTAIESSLAIHTSNKTWIKALFREGWISIMGFDIILNENCPNADLIVYKWIETRSFKLYHNGFEVTTWVRFGILHVGIVVVLLSQLNTYFLSIIHFHSIFHKPPTTEPQFLLKLNIA